MRRSGDDDGGEEGGGGDVVRRSNRWQNAAGNLAEEELWPAPKSCGKGLKNEDVPLKQCQGSGAATLGAQKWMERSANRTCGPELQLAY